MEIFSHRATKESIPLQSLKHYCNSSFDTQNTSILYNYRLSSTNIKSTRQHITYGCFFISILYIEGQLSKISTLIIHQLKKINFKALLLQILSIVI